MTTIQIVFGSEAVNKMIHNQPLSEEEKTVHQKTYTFKTEEEKLAFMKGIEQGIGWQTAYIVEE
ncbi:MAG: hypothetical protein ACK48W_02315 [Bacteroidota bacterium]|jgi:hypothetical protein